jgi:hypothetical protein
MFVLVTTGGLEHLVNEPRLSWNRLRMLIRDEAGYTTAIVVALVAVIALAAFMVLWMGHLQGDSHPSVPSPWATMRLTLASCGPVVGQKRSQPGEIGRQCLNDAQVSPVVR